MIAAAVLIRHRTRRRPVDGESAPESEQNETVRKSSYCLYPPHGRPDTNTQREGEDGLIVTFSDGTTAGYVTVELLELRPFREPTSR
jgi:hypothetical protein